MRKFSCALGLLILVLCRGVLLDELPLFDKTEGRYASTSLAMSRSHDWVTPVVQRRGEEVAFLGKPPLAFWAGSASLSVFGVSEWSARLPGFLCGLLSLLLIFLVTRRLYGRDVGWLASFAGCTSFLFFALWGSVTLDIFGCLAVTGAIASYVFANTETETRRRTLWGLGVFVWLGVGMLAKGPVMVILACAPIALHCATRRAWSELRSLPWWSGTALFVALWAPWYALAELRNPGFLAYFLLHEHFLRYLTTDYGDLYGKSRELPYGAIWGALLAGTMPWPMLLLNRGSLPRLQRVRAAWNDADHWTGLFLFWGVVPALFFTFARAPLMTYVLPATGGLAVLIAREVNRQLADAERARWIVPSIVGPYLAALWALLGYAIASSGQLGIAALAGIAAVTLTGSALWIQHRQRIELFPALLALAVGAIALLGSRAMELHIAPRTTREVIQAAHRELGDGGGRIVVIGGGQPSMDFYGGARVAHMHRLSRTRLRAFAGNEAADTFVIRADLAGSLKQALPCLAEHDTFGEFALFVETSECGQRAEGSQPPLALR